MTLLKLIPAYKDYIWGGHRLVDDYHKEYDGAVLAESWELSCHPDGLSRIAGGPWKGRTLKEYIEAEGWEILGTNCAGMTEFPLLIKLIDAKDDLSIQVHPDDRYAREHEGQNGKTEMWYVLDCGEDAFLYCGFREEISREELRKRIGEGTLLEVLNAAPVQKGDVLFIEAGTIHAICRDIVVAEIQQNSNVTYRVYDYGRRGADGRQRELHIEKALDVVKRRPAGRKVNCRPHLASCGYFTVDRISSDGRMAEKMAGTVDESSFACFLITEGSGQICCEGEAQDFVKGDSFFLPAGSHAYEIKGACEVLVTTVGDRYKGCRENRERQKDGAL